MAITRSTPSSTGQTNHFFPLSKGHIVLALVMCMTIVAVAAYMGIWYRRKDKEDREKFEMLEAILKERVRTAEAEAVARQIEEDRVRVLANLEELAGESGPSRT